MSSFTNTTIQVLVAGAIVLGAGVYYQIYATQQVEQALQALRQVDSTRSRADTTKQHAEQYVTLLAGMARNKTDRQEPFSLVSEFSPQEINQLGPLLDKTYQRDGYFFLENFRLAWQQTKKGEKIRPRIELELKGRKVLLFSDIEAAPSSPATVNR